MNKAIKTVLTLTAMLAAGCNDGTVSPKSQSSEATLAGGGSTANLTSTDTLRFSFTIDPSRTTWYYLGSGNSITFPAGSLCDPSTSSYGPTEWDKPCSVATAPVTISTKAWLDSKGFAHVDFNKQVRFVPTANPAGWVVMSLTDWGAASDPWTKILYCDQATTKHCVDEARSDPSLVTVKNPVTGRLTRRVKHFSGYSLTSGRACDPSSGDPDCVDEGSDFSKISIGGLTLNLGGLLNGLKRESPIQSQTASAVIGAEGGSFSLPGAGLSVVVPAGAVSQPTSFSVTSRGGKLVAYDFEPHGTRFAVPLQVTQSLNGVGGLVNGLLGNVKLAYFADASQVDEATGTVRPTESLNVAVNLLTGKATVNLWHFSGYMMASGRE